jgi:radical SAM protein with 4Fe4S-binding SPASM domain
MLSRIEQATGRPLRAMIEISDRCNEVCVHCYQEQGRKGEMTTEQIKGVMDELAQLGVLILTLSGGEATLRKDFLELVAHARARGFAVRLFTNGLTMTAELARALRELAVQLVEISLYSHRAEVHDFVTGVQGSFDKTVAGVRRLAAEGVHVHVKTPIMSVNEHELEPYRAFASSLGATYAFDAGLLMPREAEDRSPEMFSRRQEYHALTERIVPSAPRVPGKREPKPLSSKLCGAGEYLQVEPDGELRPCTMLHVDLGNAAADGVRAALQASQYADLRALRWRDVHGCRDCDLRAHCGRCHARALAEVGDALAPYPSACERARASYEHDTGTALRVLPGARRDVELGPYRAIADGVVETVAHEVTVADDALALRLGWTRRAGGGLGAPRTAARPGELVQIRRPGRAAPRAELVPGTAILRESAQCAAAAHPAVDAARVS